MFQFLSAMPPAAAIVLSAVDVPGILSVTRIFAVAAVPILLLVPFFFYVLFLALQASLLLL